VAFSVAADAYDRFMGRYSVLLAPQLADLAGVRTGQRVLDVGCGPGALTAELVDRVGTDAVTAVDPSEQFVDAFRQRFPSVAVQRAFAEDMPFADGEFDASLLQLVVHFLADPVAGLRESARVTRSQGVVAACVWDHAGGQTPLGPFWEAARELDSDVKDESDLAGAREGHLTELFEAAGLRDVEETTLVAHAEHTSFDAWWEPFLLGVGPAGAYANSLDEEGKARLQEACRRRLGEPPYVFEAAAWAARGRAA
jgi:SAM-dependent methyltransferase